MRKTRKTLAGFLVLVLMLALAPIAAAASNLWAPAAVGGPTSGYATGAQVALAPETCSGGTTGLWLDVPAWLTAPIDAATGVWQQPASWIVDSSSGITAPASGSDVCYLVDAVKLGGSTFGTAGSTDTWATIYPSGSWQAPSGQQAPSTGMMAAAALSTAITVVTATGPSQYTTLDPSTINGTLPGGDALAGGQYYSVPSTACTPPDVLVIRKVNDVAAVVVCVLATTQNQTVSQAVYAATSVQSPVIGLFNGDCTGGPRDGQAAPYPDDTGAHTAADIAWCQQ